MKILPNSLDNSVENVAVIMSTYNGERYIREQIESILNQKKVSVLLFIRDDGSKDNTRKIIKEYCTNYRNVIWIDELKKENLGVRDSFLRSLTFVYKNYPDIHYFSFSDQDDYWMEDKLFEGVCRLEKSKNTKGALYYTNKIFVDKNLNEIKKENIVYYNDYMEILWPSLASGCTMIFNRSLVYFTLKNYPKINCIHDSWIYRLAKCIGSDIYFDEKPLILYRQHDMNVCGMKTTILHHDLRYMLNNMFKNIFSSREHIIQNFVKELYLAKEDMTSESKYYSEIIIDYNYNIKHKFKLMFIKGFSKRRIKTRMVWIYKVIFNMI